MNRQLKSKMSCLLCPHAADDRQRKRIVADKDSFIFLVNYLLILVSARLLGFHLIAEAQSVKFIMRVFDLKNHFDCLYDSCQII